MAATDDKERVVVSSLKRVRFVCQTIMFAMALNAIVFGVTACFGGDAWSGRQIGNHFYLANHGKFTEASPMIFHLNLACIYSAFVLFPLNFLAYMNKRYLERHIPQEFAVKLEFDNLPQTAQSESAPGANDITRR